MTTVAEDSLCECVCVCVCLCKTCVITRCEDTFVLVTVSTLLHLIFLVECIFQCNIDQTQTLYIASCDGSAMCTNVSLSLLLYI